jgi:1,4-dihydroxy-2-naphthoate octaprenyltransferase
VAVSDWIEGARPKTLPAAVAPVAAGTAAALHVGGASLVRAVLAGVLALALQVGVNFANDYSDGIRGTDAARSGPPRLTGGGMAAPRTVKFAAFAAFGVGAVAGLSLIALSGQWWLLFVGLAAIAAAWFYTGGSRPYGYMGLGEVFVFVFFGLVATAGTTYTQILSVPWQSWVMSCAIGSVACALLMVNNIRDIPTDAAVGKKTLAVRIGDRSARWAFVAMVAMPVLTPLAFLGDLGLWVALVIAPVALLAYRAVLPVLTGASGRDLIPALRTAGQVELAFGVTLLLAYAGATYLN